MTEQENFSIGTGKFRIDFVVDPSGRLFQTRFGVDGGTPALSYPAWGNGWTFEPALQVVHADGNTSTELRFVRHNQEGDLHTIALRDPEYPFEVDLLFQVYPELDVIESWTRIRHQEERTIALHRFASSSPQFGPETFFLTQFRGDWNDEVNMVEEPLTYGVKTLDSKLGVRAHQFRQPWFLLSQGQPATENEGIVLGGSLAWSGSYQFQFEVLPDGHLQVIAGANPFAGARYLESGETFETPKMVWALSESGTGTLSRNLHRYTREHVIRDGAEPRAILLNNWEATYFTFDEAKIVSLFDGAKELGMELFLLDDGWFGVKYPRDDDSQGLGDWIPDPKKLPTGVGALVRAAEARGLRFGIWLEPEMVNPRSELFEAHPDWAIQQPKRELELSRNQLTLDLTNPEVEAYCYDLCDRVLRENPGISYVKWDCNRFLTQAGSPFLPASRQSHLWVDYVQALYRVMNRLATEHPHVELMMCSGGGGRVDHAGMRYAHEFWPSDNTDPARRVFMQWAYSYFFPAITVSAHVTDMGHRSMKFAFDVAMSGRLGMDLDVDKLSPEDRVYAKTAVATYKEIRDVVQLGEQFRLESPYDGSRSALMNVLGDRAVGFVYSLGEVEGGPLRLQGLAAETTYAVSELTGPNAGRSHGELTGLELMTVGLSIPALGEYESFVFELRG